MPKFIFTHRVNDPDFWASKHSERVEMFASWGSNVIDYVSADGSDNVAVSVEVHDVAGMQAALESPELEAAKKAHGVLEPITMHIEKS